MLTFPSDLAQLRIAAQYFDGRSARAHAVTLELAGATLSLRGEGIARDDDIATLRISEPMGLAPRLISYPDGAHCEVRDHAGIKRMLDASHFEDSWVVRLQHRWRWAFASLLVTIALVFAGYRWALPAAAEFIAFNTPESVLSRLGDGTLALLDQGLFKPSQLPQQRQRQLADGFARLVPPAGAGARYALHFRDGGPVGANALALPDGSIVLTDQLVKLAAHDEEILGVLAHELGHIDRRHGLRMLIQGSVVAFVVSWYLGDISSIAAGVPTLLLQARYSREHESEADAFGAAMLKANGVSPVRLADMLERLEAAHSKRRAKEQDDAAPKQRVPPQQDARAETHDSFGDYLASHPATRERIEALRRMR